MRVQATIVVGLALAACVPIALADAPGGCAGVDACSPKQETLSRPGHISRWAFVLQPATVRRAPRSDARPVGRLRLKTQDGTDELTLVLARTVDATGRRWLKVRLPILPNNSTGWVPQAALGGFHKVTTWLRVDTRHFTARLIRSGRTIFKARVGVGQSRWPTPHGQFFVRDRLEGFNPSGMYGPLAFGLNARSAVLTDWPAGGFVGVHGTDEPNLIPGRVSHGCIRMRNRDILRLGRLMPVGTPVTVS
jgi:hypothetical protein